MGDFSRDPKERLADSVSRHYVGVRMQQGVPILDTDWNELEDLRKYEMQSFIENFIGNGVPSNNDGFLISALDGGGVNTIILETASNVATMSALEIDLPSSSASSILGFSTHNSRAINYENAPARLTGFHNEPFLFGGGETLTLTVNVGASVTITFAAAEASAADVVGVINAATSLVMASAGSGNDFIISGGNGTAESAGRHLVSGSEIVNEYNLAYSSQQLYMNNALANKWGVDPIDELSEPTVDDRQDLVYVDVWEREVSSSEDDDIIVTQVGIETTLRTRREWAVRVAPGVSDLSGITTTSGHKYAALALIDRKASNLEAIKEVDITDLRKRRLTLSDAIISPIYVKGEFSIDRVNSGLFRDMLASSSHVYRALLDSDYFLNDNFDDATGAESVKLLRSFQDIRVLAETTITDAESLRLDNDDAGRIMLRLYWLQREFINTIRPLAEGISKRAGTLILLDLLDTWLEGNGADIPGLRNSVLPEESPDLGNAYDAQIFINQELGRRTGILPRGKLNIVFVSVQGGAINPGSSYGFVYSVESVLNVDETIELALSDTQGVFDYSFTNVIPDPNHPGDTSRAIVTLLKDETKNIAFDLHVPGNIAPGTKSRLIVNARSKQNPSDIDYANFEINVEVGTTIGLPAETLLLTLINPANFNPAKDIQPIGKASDNEHYEFTIEIDYQVDSSITDEFVFTVDFLGNSSSFEVVFQDILDPFDVQGSTRIRREINIGATATALNGQESLMVIRLAKTDASLPEPFFREVVLRVITNISA